MVALPRSLPRPKKPSVKGKVHSSSQKKPDKCVKGSSFSCGATCLPKLTKEGKRTICHMAIAGNPKILVGWLARQDARTLELNKGRSGEGKGKIYLDDKGTIQEEDMSSYLTGTKKIVMEDGKAIAESKGFNVKPFMEKGKLTPEGRKVNAKIKSLEEKSAKAEAIAARATHPEQIKRANLLMSRFRGQAKKLKDWVGEQIGRLEDWAYADIENNKVEPVKKVEKLATAIAENASQLKEAVAQVEQPKPTKTRALLTEMTAATENIPKAIEQGSLNLKTKAKKEPAIAAKPVETSSSPKSITSKLESVSSSETTKLSKEKPLRDGEIPSPTELRNQGYEIIGRGAYGRVYQKGDQAVKYGKTLSESEYAIAKQADKLGIGPKVYGRNKVDGVIGMSMEFLSGNPLVALNPLSAKKINGKQFDQTLDLMGKLHTNGIAHRDLHTGNLILDGDGLKVIDFGSSVSNNPEEIIKEMLKPAFMTGDSFGDDEIATPNSKLRSRYDSARQEFLDQYGKSGENWPKGKDAEKAIGDFYEKVLSSSKSQPKSSPTPTPPKKTEQPVEVAKSTSKSPVRPERPSTKELQGKLPDKYRSMSNDELAAHSGDLRRTLADLIVFDRMADKTAQTRLKEEGFDVSNGEKLKEATNTIRELLSSFPATSTPSPRPNPVPAAQPNVVATRTAPPVKNAKNTDESNLTNLGRETKDNNWYQLSSDAKDVGTRNPFDSKRKTLLAKEENGTINGGVTVKFDDKFENAEITAIASTEGKQWESTMEGLIVNAAIAVKKGFLSKDKSGTQRNPIISRTSSNNAEIEILEKNGFTQETGKRIERLKELGWLKPNERVYTASVDDILSEKKQADRLRLQAKGKAQSLVKAQVEKEKNDFVVAGKDRNGTPIKNKVTSSVVIESPFDESKGFFDDNGEGIIEESINQHIKRTGDTRPFGEIYEKVKNFKMASISYSVNGSYDRIYDENTEVGWMEKNDKKYTKEELSKIGIKAFGLMKEHLKTLPNGAIVFCAAYGADLSGTYRARIYQKAGFGPPVESVSGSQFAIKQNGKLYPLTESQLITKAIESE